MELPNHLSKEEYDDIPVYYCKHCLSLRIKDVEHIEGSDYCDECGSTDIGYIHRKEWEALYEKAHHGMKFLNKKY